MNTKAESLCENLQYEILSWLPPRSLLRCASVCKSWYSTIHSSSFIKKHTTNLSRTENNNRTVLVMPSTNPSLTCTLYSGKTCDIRSTLTLPFTAMGFISSIRVVGSCNGLICLVDQSIYRHFRLYIWNPSIRTLKLLPPCSFRSSSVELSTFGIGFNELSNDYRVVRITNYQGNLRTEVEVYSLSTDSWRMVNLDDDRVLPVSETENNSVSVNGYIYWLATGRRILSFNMYNDSFEEIIHPSGTGFYLGIYHIAVLRGQLCVLIAPYFGFSNRRDKEHEIWMMREHGVYESWTNICRIRQAERFFGTFGLTVKGELLHFTAAEDKNLCLYDHENLQYYDLCKGSINLAISYMESLVLLDTQSNQELKKKRKFSSM